MPTSFPILGEDGNLSLQWRQWFSDNTKVTILGPQGQELSSGDKIKIQSTSRNQVVVVNPSGAVDAALQPFSPNAQDGCIITVYCMSGSVKFTNSNTDGGVFLSSDKTVTQYTSASFFYSEKLKRYLLFS